MRILRDMNDNVITFIGSYNTAMFLKSSKLPSVGETVIADEFYQSAGGKATNQAVSASVYGAKVRFIGRIGTDTYGRNALTLFKKYDIISDSIVIDKDCRSGIGISFIDNFGKNMISVAPGANYYLSKNDIDSAENEIKKSLIVGFQLQNSLDTVFYGIKKAHSLGVKTFLDPSPVTVIPDDVLGCIDIIKPNEVEASKLSGIDVKDFKSASDAGRWFIDKGVKDVIITLGAKGAVYISESGVNSFDAPVFEVKDTTGAGDVFIGALLANYSIGLSISDSIPFAIFAATLSTRNFGVIDSIPKKKEVISFMKAYNI